MLQWMRCPRRVLPGFTLIAALAQDPATAQTCAPGQSFSAGAVIPLTSSGRKIAVADFNGDHVPDLAITNQSRLVIRLGAVTPNGTATYPTGFDYTTTTGPQGIGVGDFDGDGIQDLAVALFDLQGGIDIYRGLGSGGVGNGQFERAQYIPAGKTWMVRGVDVTGDGALDLVVTGDTGTILVYRGTGTGMFEFHRSQASAGHPRGFALADLDGDGRLDVATSTEENTIAVHPGLPDGAFAPPIFFAMEGVTFDVAAADLNADGDLDLAVATYTANAVVVLFGTAGLDYLPPVHHVLSWPVSLAIADLDADQRPDITTGSQSSTLKVLWNDGGGLSAPDAYAPSLVVGMATHDMNLDGGPDLVVVSTDGTARILINECDAPHLTLTTASAGHGIVVRDPERFEFRPGWSVTLSAIPEQRYRFDHWSGDTTEVENPLPLVMTKSVQFTAHFVPDMKNLSFTVDGMGQVETDPAGDSFLIYTAIGAYAMPFPGYRFTGWTGTVETDSALIRFQMLSDVSLTAHFEPDPATTGVKDRPVSWSLSPLVPNPGHGDFHLGVGSPRSAHIDLAVLDLGGRRVRSLLHGTRGPGWWTISWDGRDDRGQRATPGRYWVRLQADGRTLTRELTLLH